MSYSVQYFFATKKEIGDGFLNEEESHHCLKVLRKKVGDQIHLLDGEGGIYRAEILANKGKLAGIKVIEARKEEYNLPHLHLLVAPTKNIDRFEFFIEKACELGVKEITPIICGNSERKHLNVEKLRKRMLAACKQSGTTYFPQLNEVIRLKEVGKYTADQKLIAHCYSQETPHLKAFDLGKSTMVLIGPEGDFLEEEVKLLMEQGYHGISLGPKRLRTETAAVFVCATFNLMQ